MQPARVSFRNASVIDDTIKNLHAKETRHAQVHHLSPRRRHGPHHRGGRERRSLLPDVRVGVQWLGLVLHLRLTPKRPWDQRPRAGGRFSRPPTKPPPGKNTPEAAARGRRPARANPPPPPAIARPYIQARSPDFASLIRATCWPFQSSRRR